MSQRIKKAALRSGVSAMVAAAALTFGSADMAAAQGFWNLFAPQQPVQRAAPQRVERPVARAKVRDLSTPARYRNPDLKKSEGLLPESAQGPVTIVVSTDRQHLTVYDGDKAVSDTVVSTGTADHPTPYGVFSVIEKQVFHRSTLYDDAPMPYMQRLTWSGVAMHEGHVTGRPASHGCIRLPAAYAKDLYRFTRRGVRVVISREDVKPTPLTEFSSVFFQAPPKRYVMGDSVEAQRTPGEIEGPSTSLGNYQVKATRNLAEAMPISVLVNRKAGKLYVRRNFKPLFEVPIEIDEPGRPLGAHMFVALPASEGQTAWSSVSVPGRTREAMLGATGKRAGDISPIASQPTAAEALKRIHIAPGVAARLAGIAGPGAVFIISDEGARNKESWDGTNFIALVD